MVTAFILQLYEELQPDNSDLVVQILSAISTQLQTAQLVPASNASISTNQTQAPFPKIAFRAPASVVRINVLWFCSLIVSLVVGSLGMLTKQWLRDYLSVSYTTPRELVRIRQYRQIGLKVWRVTEIIAFLPLLLQFALILFLVGLIDLLWSINVLVAALVTIPIAFWVLTYTATTCAPAFFPQCPYKSPQARIFDSLCHPFRKVYRSRFKQRGFSGSRDYLLVADMTEHSGLFWGADKLETRMRSELEVDAVVNADTMFVDDEFLEKTIKTCVRDFSGSNVVLFLRQFVGYRTKQSRDYLGDHRDTLWRLGEHGIVTVVQIAVDALWRFMDDFQSVGTKSVEPWVTELLDFISAASIHTQWYGKRLTKTSDSRPVIELLLRFVTSGIERLDMDAFQLLLPILSDPRGTAITPLITSSEGMHLSGYIHFCFAHSRRSFKDHQLCKTASP